MSDVLITIFRDSDDNQWSSILKWLLVRREKIINYRRMVDSEPDVVYGFKLDM